MKKSIFLIALFIFSVTSFAQHELLVKKSAKGLYLSHVVVPKENFYSVGRTYNVPAKEIAAFNGLDMAHGLTIGQVIQIPLNNGNFSQEKASGKPVYYLVGQKEGLFRVSANNNNVLLANLRKWNSLSSDNINPGQKLIVGYLLLDGVPAATASQPVVEKKPVTEEPKSVTTKTEVAEKKAQPIMLEEIVEKKTVAPVINEEIVPEKPVVQKKEPAKSNVVLTSSNSKNDGSGFFKSQFNLQIKVQPPSVDETITAGIFKTASGWQDGKYYALIDDVEPGTILKLINPNNDKIVYVKVLDKMSGIRQNQGYDLRMSNAAAVALDIQESDKFFVRVVY